MNTLRFAIAFYLARTASQLIQLLHLGSGSTWPGQIALMIDPRIVQSMVKRQHLRVILVAGTNGKTTTSSMIRTVIEQKEDERVIYNAEGANLLNGVASALIARLSENTKGCWCVFECDENALGEILRQTEPAYVVGLNLFRDQLDRYGEVNTIAANWKRWFVGAEKTTFILNADDPLVWSLATPQRTTGFGLGKKEMNKKKLGHDVDSINCPVCRSLLVYEVIAYSHLGAYHCDSCGFQPPTQKDSYPELIDEPYPLIGQYNRYNTHAALCVCEAAIGIKPKQALAILNRSFTPMFGRQETVQHASRTLTILLSKNPAGFNQSLAALAQIAQTKRVGVLLLLNDHIPDGRDVSWIWDVDMDGLAQSPDIHVAFGGDRAYDMGLRYAYELDDMPAVERADIFRLGNAAIIQDIPQAIDCFTESAPQKAALFIVATYSAMLAAREHIVGSSFAPQQS